MLLVSLGPMDRLLPPEISILDEGRSPPVGAACSPPVLSGLSSIANSLSSKIVACEARCSFESSMLSWSPISVQPPSSSNHFVNVFNDSDVQETEQQQQPRAVCFNKVLPSLCSMPEIKDDGVYVLNITAVPKRKRREHGERWV